MSTRSLLNWQVWSSLECGGAYTLLDELCAWKRGVSVTRVLGFRECGSGFQSPLSRVHHYTCSFRSQTCTSSPLLFNSTEIAIIYEICPCPVFLCHETEFPGACGGGKGVLKNTFWVTAWEVFIVFFFSPSDSGSESIMGIEQANT